MSSWPGAWALTGAVTALVGADASRYPSGTSLLVTGRHSRALIDPSLDVLHAGGPPVEVDHVVLSHVHEDHIAGLSTVPTAEVWVHPADRVGLDSLDGLMEMYGMPAGPHQDHWRGEVANRFGYVSRPDAHDFVEGETLDLGDVTVSLMHLPGHTRGHSAVVITENGHPRVAYVGDIDLSSFGPYYGDAWSSLEDFDASLDRVTSLEADWYATFHHKGMIEGCDAFVSEVARYREVITRRHDRILDAVGEPRTLESLIAQRFIYRPGVELSFVDSVERRSISMHLERLIAESVVEVLDDGSFVAVR